MKRDNDYSIQKTDKYSSQQRKDLESESMLVSTWNTCPEQEINVSTVYFLSWCIEILSYHSCLKFLKYAGSNVGWIV